MCATWILFDRTMATQLQTQPPATSPSKSGLRSPATQLKIASLFTVAFGLMIALGSHQRTDGPIRLFADLIFWDADDRPDFTDDTQLLAAILGGVMASWGVIFWLLTDALAEGQPALLKRVLFTTLAVWFTIDSAGSLASGGWSNVIGNLGFLALFALPARRL